MIATLNYYFANQVGKVLFFFFNVNTQCRQVSREMVLSYTAGKDINSSISLEGNKAILSYVLKLCTAFDLEVNTGGGGRGLC